ncbi:hypothetical protein ACQ4PT_018422 [Festuca glaucescens]
MGVEGRRAGGFVRTSGARFMVGGRPSYSNGFNAYWLMYMGSNPGDRSKVIDTLDQAARLGATLIRTWAFNDGGSNRPLQVTPGVYNEDTFLGLDFVIAEAKKRGVYLILSLVNNWSDFGGKNQYVQWAREQGHYLGSDEDFFTDSLTQRFYMNHIKGPHTSQQLHGGGVQGRADNLRIGAHERTSRPERPLRKDYAGLGDADVRLHQVHRRYTVGTDFISNNRIPTVDFATIHSYPDQWVSGSSNEAQVEFMRKWMASHIEDAAKELQKPLIVSEFGWSSRSNGYTVAARDDYFCMVYDAIYASVKEGGPCAGGLFWQLMAPGMDGWTDGYEVVVERCPTTTAIISQECAKIDGFTPRV